jgi:alcohol dehydrogenase (NADP+)
MDIFLTAYSPLGSGDRNQKAENEPLLLRDEAVLEIAQKHGCSPAQTLLAWAVMRETSVIPKSMNPERLKENLAAVDIELDRDDLRKLSMLRKFRYINGNIFTQNGSPYKLTDLWDY